MLWVTLSRVRELSQARRIPQPSNMTVIQVRTREREEKQRELWRDNEAGYPLFPASLQITRISKEWWLSKLAYILTLSKLNLNCE